MPQRLTHQTRAPSRVSFLPLDELTGFDCWRGFYLSGERILTAYGCRLTPGDLNSLYYLRERFSLTDSLIRELKREQAALAARFALFESLPLGQLRAVGPVTLGDVVNGAR